MTENAGSEKPSVLIVGGLGYIGRFLALHIHNNNLASQVRIVDKQLPELAYLSPEFKEACPRDIFVQADASREQSFPRVFDRPDGSNFTYVFNCAGETRYSQEDEVYRARSYDLSVALGREAAKRHIPVFVQCSSGQVYKPAEEPRKETDKLKPWTKQAKWSLAASEELGKIEGLNLVVLRFANVYGPYTKGFLGTALCMARVYQHLGKEMKWLWDSGLRTNTVHVVDAARALWRAAEWYVETGQAEKKMNGIGTSKKSQAVSHPIFNIVDHTETTQGILASLIETHFSIPTGFQGTLVSSFARIHLDSVVDDVNDEILDPWAELQKESSRVQEGQEGPIGPFVEAELLKDTDLSLNGSLFEKTTGFGYERNKLTTEEVADVVKSFEQMGWWP